MGTPLRLALLISGGGTTMAAILQACKNGGQLYGKVEPALVISSALDAGGIEKALAAGLSKDDVVVIDPRNFGDPRQDFGEAIITACRQRSVDVIGQYGWMPTTPPNVVTTYWGKMINQHCGPLDPGRPDFGGQGMYGKRVHCARLYFVRSTRRDFWTEAVAQRVGIKLDAGPVLHRATLPILPDDDPISLQQRLLPVEHQAQIETLELFASGRIRDLPTRTTPLVAPDEELTLQHAKQIARRLFPKG